MIDETLKQYATSHQWKCYTLSDEIGVVAAAKKMGVSHQSVSGSIQRLMNKAARQGYSPAHDMTHTAPESHFVKGVSTLYGDDGQVKQQWVKTDLQKEQALESALEAIKGVCDEIKPVAPKPPPKKTLEELCTTYVITDYHLGMYAYAPEAGSDWDVKIATQVLMNAIGEMADGSPDSEVGIFCQLGDFLHWDGLDAVTPQSKHILDADTRYDLLAELAINLSVSAIDLLLTKHKKVIVFTCEGNHDQAGSVWLRKAIKALYAKEKRVEVDDTSFPFYAYLHGQTLLGFHHGHKVKNKSLPALFAGEPRYRPLWGQATYTYIHTGHYHHTEQDRAEGGGAVVERHNTLAARDAYSARGGYISERRAQAITYHMVKGERSRVVVTPEYED